MSEPRRRRVHQELTERILAAAFEVSNTLGCGFLEEVYEKALACELRRRGLRGSQQAPMRTVYQDETVGEYVADLIVKNCVLVEIKAVEALCPVHAAQVLNYLAATELPVGLLLNFGQTRLKVRRLERPNRRPAASDE